MHDVILLRIQLVSVAVSAFFLGWCAGGWWAFWLVKRSVKRAGLRPEEDGSQPPPTRGNN